MKTDFELIREYAETNAGEAFAELAARHQQMVYRTCLRLLANAQDAEDAAQAVFIVLAKKAGRLAREGALGGWLHNVARRVVLDLLKRRRRQEERRRKLAMESETADGAEKSEAAKQDVLAHVDEELARLSSRLRQAVILRYLEGRSEKEAAELAGCPQGTMGRRASEGIGELRRRLAKRGLVTSAPALIGLLAAEAQAAPPAALLSTILTISKAGAAGGAAGASGTSIMLAEGTMKAMLIGQVKLAAAVVGAVVIVGGGTGLALKAAADSGKQPPGSAQANPMKINPGLTKTNQSVGLKPVGIPTNAAVKVAPLPAVGEGKLAFRKMSEMTCYRIIFFPTSNDLCFVIRGAADLRALDIRNGSRHALRNPGGLGNILAASIDFQKEMVLIAGTMGFREITVSDVWVQADKTIAVRFHFDTTNRKDSPIPGERGKQYQYCFVVCPRVDLPAVFFDEADQKVAQVPVPANIPAEPFDPEKAVKVETDELVSGAAWLWGSGPSTNYPGRKRSVDFISSYLKSNVQRLTELGRPDGVKKITETLASWQNYENREDVILADAKWLAGYLKENTPKIATKKPDEFLRKYDLTLGVPGTGSAGGISEYGDPGTGDAEEITVRLGNLGRTNEAQQLQRDLKYYRALYESAYQIGYLIRRTKLLQEEVNLHPERRNIPPPGNFKSKMERLKQLMEQLNQFGLTNEAAQLQGAVDNCLRVMGWF
jgi:RNA polymerase sigma factor (sigma-70 family)